MITRDAKGLWKKGQSGNPGGRPKLTAEVRDLARQHTTAAIEALVANLDDANGSVRNHAAGILLDRGWGKPPQAITGDGEQPLVVVIRRFSESE